MRDSSITDNYKDSFGYCYRVSHVSLDYRMVGTAVLLKEQVMLKMKKWVAGAVAALCIAIGMTSTNLLWAGSSDGKSALAVEL